MKKLLIPVIILILIVGGIGLWRGWFTIQTDPAKFKKDREALSKTFGEKAKALKTRISTLMKKSEGLQGEEKSSVEKELAELQKKHDLLEKQIKETAESGMDTFGTLEREMTENHDALEKQIEQLTRKLEKGKEK